MVRISLFIVAAMCALTFSLAITNSVSAHEERKVGSYQFTVGWADEPTFVGFKNGVALILKDARGKPVLNLGDALKVEVLFGDQKSDLMALEPAFDLEEGFGTPGDYRAALIPTRPGTYTFHFVGTIRGQKVDQKFTSSEKTFDSPRSPSEVQFPAKDPSTADLASRLERLSPRVDTVQAAASQARVLGAAALVVGILAFASARRRRTA